MARYMVVADIAVYNDDGELRFKPVFKAEADSIEEAEREKERLTKLYPAVVIIDRNGYPF